MGWALPQAGLETFRLGCQRANRGGDYPEDGSHRPEGVECRVGLHGSEQAVHERSESKEGLLRLVIHEYRLHGIIGQTLALEPSEAMIAAVSTPSSARSARVSSMAICSSVMSASLSLTGVSSGVSFVAAAGTVDCEGSLEVTEDAGVVHDQPVLLRREDSVGTGDSLHERMVAHQ
jgi:hypothetical protein